MATQPLPAPRSKAKLIESKSSSDNKSDDEIDIYEMQTQLLPTKSPQKSEDRNVSYSIDAQAPTVIDKENIYDMATQALPTSTPYSHKTTTSSVPSTVPRRKLPIHIEDDDFFDMPTQRLPTPVRGRSLRMQRTISASASKVKMDRITPDTDEDSAAKLIPKSIEPSIKTPKKDQRKSGAIKQKWIFVSSSSDENDSDEMEKNSKTLVDIHMIKIFILF